MFKLEFDTDTAAFDSGAADVEIDRILRRVSYAVRLGEVYGALLDINGNTIGQWSYTR